MICNADESEPGTFKDRELILVDPHMVLEGIAIASYAIGANTAYIYIRGEFVHEAQILTKAIAEARGKQYLGQNILGHGYDLEVHVHRGAGAYICGEETALIESIEGKRGLPRLKPPFPAVVGLFGCPTVVNNVETLACVPHILEHGGAWFAAIGTERSSGTKLFCVSGHVERPGVYEAPMGVSFREIIEDLCGGIRGGRRLKAFIPGGSSAPVLPADKVDTPADFESVAQAGSMLGSGGVIVMDETVDMVWALENLLTFYAHESCGQCTPCREGSDWAVRYCPSHPPRRGSTRRHRNPSPYRTLRQPGHDDLSTGRRILRSDREFSRALRPRVRSSDIQGIHADGKIPADPPGPIRPRAFWDLGL